MEAVLKRMIAQAAQDIGMKSGFDHPDSIPSGSTESTDKEAQDIPSSVLKPKSDMTIRWEQIWNSVRKTLR